MTTERNRPAVLATPRAAETVSDEEIQPQGSPIGGCRQVFDIDGYRLPGRWSPIIGQPRLAMPSWHRLAAAERWADPIMTRSF